MALFAVLPAIGYILGTSSRIKLGIRILFFVLLIGVLFSMWSYIPQSSFARFSTTWASIETGDIGGRVYIWRDAFSIFLEHPLIGIGSGAFHAFSDIKSAVHNTFLSVLVETGVIGLALFVIILVIIVLEAIRQPKHQAVFWLTVLFIWVIGVSAQTWEQTKTSWLFMSLIVIGGNISSQHLIGESPALVLRSLQKSKQENVVL
jgi:O-antigen ligase